MFNPFLLLPLFPLQNRMILAGRIYLFGCVFFFTLLQALFKPNDFKITRGTFKSMSKVLCNQDITPLFFESLLPDFGDPVRNSSSVEDAHVQQMMRKYGIPHDSSKSGFSVSQIHFKAKL